MIVLLANVELAAEDGLDALLLHGVEEMHCTIDLAVIGHRGCGLANFGEVGGELVYVAGTIEE